MDKYREFIVVAEQFADEFGVAVLLYGSLGLQLRLNRDLHPDDIDVLVPEYFLRDGWENLKRLMESLGYELYDLHEHGFRKGDVSAAFAAIESLQPFAGIDIAKIPAVTDGDVRYLLLDLADYQKAYEASSKDGYRLNKKEKKDGEKLELIARALASEKTKSGEVTDDEG